jgi:predicted acyl esterase
MSLLRFGQQGPIENVVVPDFPLPQTDYRSLYFAPEGKLLDKVPTASGLVSYQTQVATDIASFTYTFDKKTTLCGLPKAVVYMSCQEADDLCVGVQIRKLGSDGKALKHLTIPFERAGIKDPEEAPMSGIVIHTGPVGFLRASHRAVDPSKSMHPQYPYHPHEQLEKVPPGTVVKLEIGIFMMGSQYEAGESVRVDIMASNPLIFPDSTDPKGALLPDNKGRHKVHFGGEYPSCIILPFAEL